ncbi:hypothetical protein [Psittacicella gerlachiana]|uniref:Uncharacterized protein n=1 Tax=Psittacicella gerlachiana TaxID=2028574 RepID=A0A3A1YJZ2_9GAMM|nr:hypothetical protein [Psittacicella gerlachiana]RIY38502.1 hypothetical protein CKF59_00770 [Psittacicella gerlachiana]
MQNILNKYFVFHYDAKTFGMKKAKHYLILDSAPSVIKGKHTNLKDFVGANTFDYHSFFDNRSTYTGLRLGEKAQQEFSLNLDPQLAQQAGTDLNHIPVYIGGQSPDIGLLVYDQATQNTYYLEQKHTELFLTSIGKFVKEHEQDLQEIDKAAQALRQTIELRKEIKPQTNNFVDLKKLKLEEASYHAYYQGVKERLEQLHGQLRTSWQQEPAQVVKNLTPFVEMGIEGLREHHVLDNLIFAYEEKYPLVNLEDYLDEIEQKLKVKAKSRKSSTRKTSKEISTPSGEAQALTSMQALPKSINSKQGYTLYTESPIALAERDKFKQEIEQWRLEQEQSQGERKKKNGYEFVGEIDKYFTPSSHEIVGGTTPAAWDEKVGEFFSLELPYIAKTYPYYAFLTLERRLGLLIIRGEERAQVEEDTISKSMPLGMLDGNAFFLEPLDVNDPPVPDSFHEQLFEYFEEREAYVEEVKEKNYLKLAQKGEYPQTLEDLALEVFELNYKQLYAQAFGDMQLKRGSYLSPVGGYEAGMVLTADILSVLEPINQFMGFRLLSRPLHELGAKVLKQSTDDLEVEELVARAQDIIIQLLHAIDEILAVFMSGQEAEQARQLIEREIDCLEDRELATPINCERYVESFKQVPSLTALDYLSAINHNLVQEDNLFVKVAKQLSEAKDIDLCLPGIIRQTFVEYIGLAEIYYFSELSFIERIFPSNTPESVIARYKHNFKELDHALAKIFARKLNFKRQLVDNLGADTFTAKQGFNANALEMATGKSYEEKVGVSLARFLAELKDYPESEFAWDVLVEHSVFHEIYNDLLQNSEQANELGFNYIFGVEDQILYKYHEFTFFTEFLTVQFALGHITLEEYYLKRLRGIELAHVILRVTSEVRNQIEAGDLPRLSEVLVPESALEVANPFSEQLIDNLAQDYLDQVASPLVAKVVHSFKQAGIFGLTVAQALAKLRGEQEVVTSTLTRTQTEEIARDDLGVPLSKNMPRVQVRELEATGEVAKTQTRGRYSKQIIDLNFIKKNYKSLLKLKAQVEFANTLAYSSLFKYSDSAVRPNEATIFLQEEKLGLPLVASHYNLQSLINFVDLKRLEFKLYVGLDVIFYRGQSRTSEGKIQRADSNFSYTRIKPKLLVIPPYERALFDNDLGYLEQSYTQNPDGQIMSMMHNLKYNFANWVVGDAGMRNRLYHFSDREELLRLPVNPEFELKPRMSLPRTEDPRRWPQIVYNCGNLEQAYSILGHHFLPTQPEYAKLPKALRGIERTSLKYRVRKSHELPSFKQTLAGAIARFAQNQGLKAQTTQIPGEQEIAKLMGAFAEVVYPELRKLGTKVSAPDFTASMQIYEEILKKYESEFKAAYGDMGNLAYSMTFNMERAVINEYERSPIIDNLREVTQNITTYRKWLQKEQIDLLELVRNLFAVTQERGIDRNILRATLNRAGARLKGLAEQIKMLGGAATYKAVAQEEDLASKTQDLINNVVNKGKQKHEQVQEQLPQNLSAHERSLQEQITQRLLAELEALNNQVEELLTLNERYLADGIMASSKPQELVSEADKQDQEFARELVGDKAKDLIELCLNSLERLYLRARMISKEYQRLKNDPQAQAKIVKTVEQDLWKLEVEWCRLVARLLSAGADKKLLRETSDKAIAAGLRPIVVAQVDEVVNDKAKEKDFITAVELIEAYQQKSRKGKRKGKKAQEQDKLEALNLNFENFKAAGVPSSKPEPVYDESAYASTPEFKLKRREQVKMTYRQRLEDDFFPQTADRVFKRVFNETFNELDECLKTFVMRELSVKYYDIEFKEEDFENLSVAQIREQFKDPEVYNRIIARFPGIANPVMVELFSAQVVRQHFKFRRIIRFNRLRKFITDPQLATDRVGRYVNELYEDLIESYRVLYLRGSTPAGAINGMRVLNEKFDELYNKEMGIIELNRDQPTLAKIANYYGEGERKVRAAHFEQMQNEFVLHKQGHITLEMTPKSVNYLKVRLAQGLQKYNYSNLELKLALDYFVEQYKLLNVAALKYVFIVTKRGKQVNDLMGRSELNLNTIFALSKFTGLINRRINERQELQSKRFYQFINRFTTVTEVEVKESKPLYIAPPVVIATETKIEPVPATQEGKLEHLAKIKPEQYELVVQVFNNITQGVEAIDLEDLLTLLVALPDLERKTKVKLMAWVIAVTTNIELSLVEQVLSHPKFLEYYTHFFALDQALRKHAKLLAQVENFIPVNEKGVRRKRPKALKLPMVSSQQALQNPLGTPVTKFSPQEFALLPKNLRTNAFALFILKNDLEYKEHKRTLQQQLLQNFTKYFGSQAKKEFLLFLDFSLHVQQNYWRSKAFGKLAPWVLLKEKLGYDSFNQNRDFVSVPQNCSLLYKSPYYWNGHDLTNLVLAPNGFAKLQANYLGMQTYLNSNKAELENLGYRFARFFDTQQRKDKE